MFVYWSACFASVGMMAIALQFKPRRRNLWDNLVIAVFCGLPLIIVAGLRYDVGADYMSYFRYFERVRVGGGQERFEYLYYLLNAVVVWFGGGATSFFFVTAIIFVVAIYVCILRESPYPLLSCFLLVAMTYYFIFFNGVRQLLGCAVLLWSVRYIQQKRFIPFAICVAIAYGFHSSCAVFLPIYFIANIRASRWVIILVTAVIFVASSVISSMITNAIKTTEYVAYVASVYDTSQSGYITLAINAAITMFAMMFLDENDKRSHIYLNLQVLTLWVSAFKGKVVLINRIAWIFGLPGIILIPLALRNIPARRMRVLVGAAIVIVYFVYATYTIGVLNGNSVLPYRTIFDR